jgi:hypothetical protein
MADGSDLPVKSDPRPTPGGICYKRANRFVNALSIATASVLRILMHIRLSFPRSSKSKRYI